MELFLIIVLIFALALSVFKLKKNKLKLNKKFEEYLKEQKNKIDEECTEKKTILQKVEKELLSRENQLKTIVSEAQHQYNVELEKLQERKKANEEIVEQLELRKEDEIKNKQLNIDNYLKNYYNNNIKDFKRDLKENIKELKEKAQCNFEENIKNFDNSIIEAKSKLENIQAELNDWQRRRQVINEDILRARAIEEQQDFYRVCLDGKIIEDIDLLNEVRKKLHFTNGLNKLIYDGYIAKPSNEMIKRVLEGKSPSGIYKITSLKTKEVYIGKSTDIKSRWQQHIKTVYGVGTIAHSTLHTRMEKDGIQNFIFEKIEECPKEILGEREKFYIDLYGTKEYGLNMKAGG